jgi:hypothetical protein
MSAIRGSNAQMDKQRMLTTREHRRPGYEVSLVENRRAAVKGRMAPFKAIPTQLRLGAWGAKWRLGAAATSLELLRFPGWA